MGMVLSLALIGSAVCWAVQPARMVATVRPTLAPGNALDFATLQPPKYPRNAFVAAIEGFVELQIEVDVRGAPQHIAIVQSRPDGVFDQGGRCSAPMAV